MKHLKYVAADWTLCLLIAVALACAISAGFELPEDLPNLPVLIIGCGVLFALFLFLSARRILILLGSAAGLVLLVNGALYVRAFQPFADETANGTFIFALILFLTALLVFLLSRTRAGTAALFLLGSILCAGASFLAFPIPVWSLILFLFATPALFLYRVYRASAQASDLGTMGPGGYMIQTVLLSLTALLVAGGLFWGIVRPLAPPTQELKLITVLNTLEVLGVARTEIIFTDELISDADPARTEYSSQQNPEEPDSDPAEEPPNDVPAPPEASEEAPPQTASAETIRYEFRHFDPLWLLLLIPALAAAAYLARFLWKRHWHRRIQALSHEDAVVNYYRFFLSRLQRLGLKRPEQHTLREYIRNNQVPLQPFGIADLTNIYEKALYGGGTVTEQEYALFEQTYAGFYKALRRALGTPKYYLTAFRY